MRRSAVELRRSHSFIPLKAASIPAKNRLGSMKNSFKKQGRCCEKRDRFSLKTVTFFVQFSQQLISKKEGTAASEPPNNLRFLIKKAANTPPEMLEKFENEPLTIVPVETYQADEIKRIRNSTGLTQRSFAEYMGVSPKTVEAWEAGRNHPEGAACRSLSLMKADPEFPQKAGIIRR